jgi:AcrR family transcriptional regulator
MKRLKRPSAEITRKKIVEAAKAIFLKVGFDGAKVRAIANLADVHTNLVFHHFENKETLWANVKADILDKCAITLKYDISSAADFFESIIDFRFELFQKHPDLVKLIQWQQLTENNQSLTSNDIISPLCWSDTLKSFQEKGQLKQDIEVELMILYITYITHPPFMQTVIPLSNQQINQYKAIAKQSCLDQFLQGDMS